MSLDGDPLLLRPGRGKADLLWGCVRRLVSWVNGSMSEVRSVTLTSHSFTFSPRAHCCAASCSTWRRSRRSVLFPSTMTITCTQNKATSLLSDLHLHRRKHEYMQVWNFGVQRLCKVFVFPKYPPVREYSTHSRVFLIQHYRNILRLSNYETCFYLYISILCLLAVRRLHVRFLLRFKQSI